MTDVKYSSLPTEVTPYDRSPAFQYHDPKRANQFRSIFTYNRPSTSLALLVGNSDPRVDYSDFSENGIVPQLFAWLLTALSWCAIIFLAPLSLLFCIKRVYPYERLLVFRLGRLMPAKNPGFAIVLPCIDRWQKVDIRMRAFSIPPQQFITGDGAVVELGADVQFQIIDAPRSAMLVFDFDHTIRVLGRNAMVNSMCCRTASQLDKERILLGQELQEELNRTTIIWGMQIAKVELSQVKVLKASEPMDPVHNVLAAMARAFNGDAGIPAAAQDNNAKVAEREPEFDPMFQRMYDVLQPPLNAGVGAGLDALYQLDVHDPVTNTKRTYWMDLRNGSKCIQNGTLRCENESADTLRNPNVMIWIEKEHLEQLLERQMTPLQAYICGNLRMNGDYALIMGLEGILNATAPVQPRKPLVMTV